MPGRRTWPGALALALLLAAAPAWAAGKGAAGAKGKAKGKGKAGTATAGPSAAEVAALKEIEAGNALFAEAKYADALPHFETARDLVPDSAGPYRALGYTYKHLGRLEEARAAFQKYVDLRADATGTDLAKVEAIRGEVRAIDAELAKRAAALTKPDEKDMAGGGAGAGSGDAGAGAGTSAAGAGGTDGSDGRGKKGFFTPLRGAGLGAMVLGAGALGTGIFFTVRWLGARSSFSAEYDMVRESLTVTKGTAGTLYICNDDDYGRFTAESQASLAAARGYCKPMALGRILGPVLGAAGVVFVAAGAALLVVGAPRASAASPDPYAFRLPGLTLRLDAAPLRGGGGMLLASGIF